MIDLTADEIRDVIAANIQISAALNKLDLDGVDWDQRSKLNPRLVDPNSRFVSCDGFNQFDSMSCLRRECCLLPFLSATVGAVFVFLCFAPLVWNIGLFYVFSLNRPLSDFGDCI